MFRDSYIIRRCQFCYSVGYVVIAWAVFRPCFSCISQDQGMHMDMLAHNGQALTALVDDLFEKYKAVQQAALAASAAVNTGSSLSEVGGQFALAGKEFDQARTTLVTTLGSVA